MAKPEFDIKQQVLQHEVAIRTIAQWLTNQDPSFDATVIDKILNGEELPEEPKKE